MSQTARGVSLGQDAWRRLRRNRVAMVALSTLIVICLLAFLTPILPLAPPDRDHTELQYAAPQSTPLWVWPFDLDWQAIQNTPEKLRAARAELADAKVRLNNAKQRLAAAVHGARDAGHASLDKQQIMTDLRTAEDAVRRKHREIEGIVQQPYRAAGFPDLGMLSRWMVRMRYRLFGNGSIGPICGRDVLGRDMLSRIFWGARISIIVGLVATLVSLVIGVSWGAVAGYAGGWLDDAMMRTVDILYSIPFIFVVIFILTILGEQSIKTQLEYWGIDRITIFFFVVGAIYWLTMSRVVRGQVISLKHEPFVEAARALGVNWPGIIVRHILPNLFSIVIVYLTLTIPRVMLFEAFLSFLGLGVEPPNVSWGLLANEGIRVINPVRIYWWLIVYPSLALGITLFSLNFLGDGLRDALDPKMKA